MSPLKLRLKEIPRYECLREAAEHYPQLNPYAMEAFMLMLRVGDLFHEEGGALFAKHNISQARFLVLMLLWRGLGGEPCASTPAELADMTDCTRATMTGLIDTLERDGLVRRDPDPKDRRMMKVTITDAGMARMDKIVPENFSAISGLMKSLSDEECRVLSGLLLKLLGANGTDGPYKECPGGKKK